MIFDTDLIRKYFGEEDTNNPCTPIGIANNIIIAMQEPINKGERYLYWDEQINTCGWMEGKNESETDKRFYHPKELRLPNRFQGNEKKGPPLEIPALKFGESFPIGEIRRRLFVDGESRWNSFVRDSTVEMENVWSKHRPETSDPCPHVDIGHFHGPITDTKPCPSQKIDVMDGYIKDILWNYENVAQEPQFIFEGYLRELVRLARESK